MAKKDNKIILEAIKNIKASADAEDHNRRSHVDDANFENGEQWDANDKADREQNGRPCLVINKAAGVVKQLVGNLRQNDFAIKVRPVDDQSDPKTAEILNGLIRNIENISSAQVAYDNAGEGAMRGNIGYFRIVTDYSHDDTFDQDILIKRIVNPLSVYYDPHAVEPDLSDAMWCGITETMDKDTFKATYPKALASTDVEAGTGEDGASWFTEDTVKIAEYFKVSFEDKKILQLADGRVVVKGELIPDDKELSERAEDELEAGGFIKAERTVKRKVITWYKISASEILEGPTVWAGKHIPVVPVLGEEVWIEGKKHLRSAVKWMKEPARLYNWARSNMAETLALAPKQPFLLTTEQIEGHESQWQTANRKPQPYLLYNETQSGMPQRQPASITDMGAVNESQLAADDIKSATGIHDASLGAQGNETSGRAIIARQQQGDNATFSFTDNMQRAIAHAGKILVDLIPKIYDTERVVRLLNVDGSEGWAKLNAEDPMTGMKLNDITVGKYDVVVSAGPAYASKRIEAADNMVQLLQSAPAYAPIIMPRLAKNWDWPEADEISEEMQAMNPANQQQQGPSPEQQMEAQKAQMDMEVKKVELEGKRLDNQKTEIEIAGKIADTKEGQAATTIEVLKELGIIPDEK